MKSKIWILLGVIIVIVAAASAVIILPGQSSNGSITPSQQLSQQQKTQNLEQSHQINVTVKTDGTSVKVQATSASISSKLPDKMLVKMKRKVYSDIYSDTSTVTDLKYDIKTIAKKYNYTVEVTVISQLGIDKLPFPATVDGTSMVPTLKDGQNVVALKTKHFKVGDIVIARHPTYGLIIKRVAAIKDGKVFLKSDNRKVEVSNTEKQLSDGVVEISTVEKTPLDTWQPIKNVIGVVKIY